MAGLLDNISGALNDQQFQDDVATRAKRFAMIPDQSAYGAGQIPSEASLATMPWMDLIKLRKSLQSTQDQNAVAPYEHRAYMREFTSNPVDAAMNTALTLGYSPYKLATGEGRSEPQLSAIKHGLLGVWEGLTK